MKYPLHAHNTLSALSLLILSAAPLVAVATPSATSPYVTDAQNAYVHDATSNGISGLNLVLCVFHSMAPAAMVNQGPYIALVDMNKCDPGSRASASNSTGGASGATSAPNYMTAVINVTRGTGAADPMIGKVWMSLTEHGQPFHVYAHLSATQSPTAAPPYGKFRMDYISKPSFSAATMLFNGFVNANGPDVQFLDTGTQSDKTALAMTATSSTAASGTMKTTDQGTGVTTTFNFAYDGSEPNFAAGVFRRDAGAKDVCFDRAKANVERSVWRYGTYKASDGTRVDQAHPGFPITVAYSGKTYYGYAGYWGIDFQGLDLKSLPDGLISGAKIKDQRPGNTNTYLLSKVSGKLTKWTEHQKTLADMDGIPFSFWGDLTGQTADTSLTTGTWQMHWDAKTGKFIVTGKQSPNCGSNGCVMTSLSPAVLVTGARFNNLPIAGWSDAFGGNINIPPTNSAHTGADTVSFYSQAQVIPGSASAPNTLYCVSNCPTKTSINSFVNNGASSPFDPTTAQQWGDSGKVSVTYSFGNGGLTESSTPMVVTASNVLTGPYQDGITTGKLFDAPLSTTGCPNGDTVCGPANAATYYTWQTGSKQWNQSRWLTRTSNSTVVSFDPPETVSYTVPSGSSYGKWAGKKLQLRFGGFGNLDGIPGGCVSNTDNTPVSCGTSGARYVPAFAIPNGATMKLTLSGKSTPILIIVKALNTELRLRTISNCTGVVLSQPTANATLPTTVDLHDPTSSANSNKNYYIGTEPTVTAPPKVIDGVVQ